MEHCPTTTGANDLEITWTGEAAVSHHHRRLAEACPFHEERHPFQKEFAPDISRRTFWPYAAGVLAPRSAHRVPHAYWGSGPCIRPRKEDSQRHCPRGAR